MSELLNKLPDCMMPDGAEPCHAYSALEQKCRELEADKVEHDENFQELQGYTNEWCDKFYSERDANLKLKQENQRLKQAIQNTLDTGMLRYILEEAEGEGDD